MQACLQKALQDKGLRLQMPAQQYLLDVLGADTGRIDAELEKIICYRGTAEGEATLDEFLTAFVEEMPFVPLCFRNGRMCYSADVSSVSGVSEYRLFGDIDKWEINADHALG